MTIPVVLIHRGADTYTAYSIEQAKKFNSRVIFLGDEPNKSLASIVEYYPFSDYFESAKKFGELYTRLSTHGDYELFCFQRWFVLWEFMKKHNLPVAFYIDSDVLLYADVSAEFEKFKEFVMTLVHRTGGWSSYFTLGALEEFCKYLLNVYGNKESYDFEKIASHFYIRQKHGLDGGVCDMNLLEYFARHYIPGLVGEMMHVINDSTYDHCLNQRDVRYVMEGGIKKVNFEGGLPYCQDEFSGRRIKFNTLHFQGPTKALIPAFFQKGDNSSGVRAS